VSCHIPCHKNICCIQINGGKAVNPSQSRSSWAPFTHDQWVGLGLSLAQPNGATPLVTTAIKFQKVAFHAAQNQNTFTFDYRNSFVWEGAGLPHSKILLFKIYSFPPDLFHKYIMLYSYSHSLHYFITLHWLIVRCISYTVLHCAYLWWSTAVLSGDITRAIHESRRTWSLEHLSSLSR